MSVSRRIQSLLESPTKALLALVGAYVLVRLFLATQSGFGYHQGWNEGHYSLIAEGFTRHPLVPRYGENYVYNVPPLFPYLVAGVFSLLGPTELAARIVPILFAGGTIVSTYALGRQVFDDERTALRGAVLLVASPYFLLYGGRAQTDIVMLGLFTASAACLLAGYRDARTYSPWLVAGGLGFAAAFAAKQPAVILPTVVLLWVIREWSNIDHPIRRTAVVCLASAFGLLPLSAWFLTNYALAPDAFVSTWRHELIGRTAPFANLPLLAAVGIGLGVTAPLLGIAVYDRVGCWIETRPWTGESSRPVPGFLGSWLLVYGLFVMYRTPHGHQYYLVGLLPPVALAAAHGYDRAVERVGRAGLAPSPGTVRTLLIVVLVVSSLGSGAVLLEFSGEYSVAEGGGDTTAAEAGAYLETNGNADDRVVVAEVYRPVVQWYARESVPVSRVSSFEGPIPDERLEDLAANTSGTLYVVVPYTTDRSHSDLTVAYESSRYEVTVTGLLDGAWADGTDFRFYVRDRGVRVYRYVGGASTRADSSGERIDGPNRAPHRSAERTV